MALLWRQPSTLANSLLELICIKPYSVTNDEAILLLRQIADGDSKDALPRFYEAYAGGVFAMMLRMLGSRSEAEELLQEVFVELWKRAPQYNPEKAAVKTWVVRIARSRAIDLIRARNSRGAGKHVDVSDLPLEADPSSGPDAVAALRVDQSRVRAALSKLTEEHREALTLSYYGGLSHGEISQELGVPLGTIKSRILSAMKVLRRELSFGGLT